MSEDQRTRDALDAAEWSVTPQYEDHHNERISDYLLIAKSPDGARVVARVPYRSYADWLVERLRNWPPLREGPVF